MIEKFLTYLASLRRYSPKTIENYRMVLEAYFAFQDAGDQGAAAGRLPGDVTGVEPPSKVNIAYQQIRNYEVFLLDEKKEKAATVNLHLSVLSSYCKFLMKEGVLKNNPVHLVRRPKQEKRLPLFYRDESMAEYFRNHKGTLEYGEYDAKLRYIIISILANTGVRRAELIDLNVGSVDFSRKVLHVHGKGDKMREIPLVPSVCEDIRMYLDAVASLEEAVTGPDAPLLQTKRGGRLYPVLVDKAVKKELGEVSDITGRKSPHVLRHTLATDLLNDGSDLNSIKELLGHSSLAATQVYTHNSIERLQSVYNSAHPRARKEDLSSD